MNACVNADFIALNELVNRESAPHLLRVHRDRLLQSVALRRIPSPVLRSVHA